jgi:hypothetical protein
VTAEIDVVADDRERLGTLAIAAERLAAGTARVWDAAG